MPYSRALDTPPMRHGPVEVSLSARTSVHVWRSVRDRSRKLTELIKLGSPEAGAFYGECQADLAAAEAVLVASRELAQRLRRIARALDAGEAEGVGDPLVDLGASAHLRAAAVRERDPLNAGATTDVREAVAALTAAAEAVETGVATCETTHCSKGREIVARAFRAALALGPPEDLPALLDDPQAAALPDAWRQRFGEPAARMQPALRRLLDEDGAAAKVRRDRAAASADRASLGADLEAAHDRQ